MTPVLVAVLVLALVRRWLRRWFECRRRWRCCWPSRRWRWYRGTSCPHGTRCLRRWLECRWRWLCRWTVTWTRFWFCRWPTVGFWCRRAVMRLATTIFDFNSITNRPIICLCRLRWILSAVCIALASSVWISPHNELHSVANFQSFIAPIIASQYFIQLLLVKIKIFSINTRFMIHAQHIQITLFVL